MMLRSRPQLCALRVLVVLGAICQASSAIHSAAASGVGGETATVSARLKRHTHALAHLPVVFEPNRGQARKNAAFVARSRGYMLEVRSHGARVALGSDGGERPAVLDMRLVTSSTAGPPVGEDRQPGHSNYFIGADATQHVRDVPHFARVVQYGVYPGIDLAYHGSDRLLEYDFIVSPGADPGRIRLRFLGHDSIVLAPDGDLVLQLGGRQLRQKKPVLYELPDRKAVEGRFALAEDGAVSFEVSGWNSEKTLVIDPTIVLGTYLGAAGTDSGQAIAVDTSGNMYVAGTTTSTTFPTQDAYQGGNGGGSSDAFVTKINAAGTAILYSTYLGGGGTDDGRAIAVDADGSAYVAGQTNSSTFPKNSAVTSTCSNTDGFLTKLAPAGNALTYSLCIGGGGTDAINGVALDSAMNAYVTGTDGGDATIGKLNVAGSAWVFFQTLGGSSFDEGKGIAVNAAGTACVAGSTSSSNFPVSNALQPLYGGVGDAFVAKVSAGGSIVYATYLGGSGSDSGSGAGIDGSESCYAVGSTFSSGFPTHNAARPTYAGLQDAFVSAYTASGNAFIYSTFLGGTLRESGLAMAVTSAGVAHVIGESASADFPAQNPVQPDLKDVGAVFTSTTAGASFTRALISGVSVNALAVDPTNPQTVYAGTSAGVYASANGGASWSRVDTGLTYTNVQSLAVDPNAPCTLFGGVDTNDFVFNRNAVLIVSTNCGVNWGFLSGIQLGRAVRSVALTNANPAVLYFGESRNAALDVFTRHTPPGTNEFSQPGAGNYETATDPANPCTVYTGDFSGQVYKNTTCSGWNWTSVGAALNGGVLSLAVHPTNQATLIAGTNQGTIYRKLDAISPWVAVGSLPGFAWSLAYQPSDPAIVYAGSVGAVYKSIDGGASWSVASVLGPEVSAVATHAAGPNLVYAGSFSNQDVFYTQVGATGSILDSTWIGGAGLDSARGIAVDASGDIVIAGYTVAPDFPATPGAYATSSAGGRDAFVLKIDTAPGNLVANASFASGTSGWFTFATPDMSYMVSNTDGGVFQFYRLPPPAGTTNQAVVFQQTGADFLPNAPLEAQFDLGNSSSARKRISVLVHEWDFTDLHVCTFWLEPLAPMRTYTMRTHTTKAWSNATISLYAATTGSDGGFYQIDNVSVQYAPGDPFTRTDCVDPTAPAPPGGGAGPDLLTNGDFSTGLSPWGLFGQIVQQIASGVFEFYRPAGTPSGVVLQASGDAMTAGQIMTAAFDLGNSSSVRKRVTVLLHEADFSDLTACTFWLAPGQPLSMYAMRGFTTKAWTNATLSVYPATVGLDQWIRLDNVSLQRTPGAVNLGTKCVEPGDGSLVTSSGAAAIAWPLSPATSGRNVPMADGAADWNPTGGFERHPEPAGTGKGLSWRAVASATGTHVLRWDRPIDLGGAGNAQLSFNSWRSAGRSSAEVQISVDGASWQSVLAVPATDAWTPLVVDLSDFAGQIVHLRFIFRAVASAEAAAPDVWRIDDVRLEVLGQPKSKPK